MGDKVRKQNCQKNTNNWKEKRWVDLKQNLKNIQKQKLSKKIGKSQKKTNKKKLYKNNWKKEKHKKGIKITKKKLWKTKKS